VQLALDIEYSCGRKMGTASYKEGQRYSDNKHNKPT